MFDAKVESEKIIKFIQNYYKENNLTGAVIGISGGKDSGVVAGLFSRALGSDNVVGIWMPCHSNEIDKENAKKVSKKFGFELLEYDLTNTYENYVKQIKEINKINDEDLIDSNINIKPRLRMMTLYYYAAMLTRKNKKIYIVPGTSNKSEIYVGYFTKGGDNVADIQVLADLTVEEVIAVGKYIGVPDEVVNKTPDDGLSGKTDEEKLGVKYNDIAAFLNNEKINKKEAEKIERLHNRNLHKFNTPTYRK